MANLKEIRVRISSVKSTQQVTSAMKMVSAAKLRKAQDAIIQMRPYANELKKILANVTYNLDSDVDNQYTEHPDVKKILIIAIASNRGLCGGFNSNVIKKVTDQVTNTYAGYYSQGAIDVIAIGKKVSEGLKSKNIKVLKTYHELYDNMNFKMVSDIAETVMEDYVKGTYDKVEIIYNQFKNAAVQKLEVEQFLPVKIEVESDQVKNGKGMVIRPFYIFEPSMQEIVDIVIPKSLKIQFFKAMLDSIASEHGARMTAMHIATDNASDLLRELRMNYNKARQASITNEILEIVSGANALKS
jgi:F-type H+-transporting ATPase subunit gamma